MNVRTSDRASTGRWSYGPASEDNSRPPTVGTGLPGSIVISSAASGAGTRVRP